MAKKKNQQQPKNGYFTDEIRQGIDKRVKDKVAAAEKVQTATTNDEYARAQAQFYIKDAKAERRKIIEERLKANGSDDWKDEKKVKRELEKDEVWKALDKDQQAIEKGQFNNDERLLRMANINVKKRQAGEDKKVRDSEQKKVVEELIRNLGPDGLQQLGIDPNNAYALIMKDLFNRDYTQIGPAGVITTNEKVAQSWGLNLKQGSFGKAADIPEGYESGFLDEYGNNYFKLFTYYPGFKNFMVADGVMTELPPISMSTEWGNSPAASIGEELDKALNNEFLEFCAMKTTNAQTPIMRRKDSLTARSYVDSGDVSFQIKFRCYPGQQVGTKKLTTAKEWMLLLSMTTPINAACSFSVDNTIGTVVKAADGIAEAFKALKDSLSDGSNKQATAKEKADAQRAQQRAENVLAGQDQSLASFQHADARLSNPNVFGACLFGIRIYPFIFKAPLTCYISSWSVTPSREWNETANDHYYYDFVLSCTMDQKPSAMTWWNNILD